MPEFGLASGDIASPEYSEATGHVVFDMKMDITHKIIFLKNGHQSPDLIEYTFLEFILVTAFELFLLRLP